ncbi:Flp family type IVb pilin [Sphingomonas lacunae]|uniref:Flp family type IVb pilin n=1 Tax=Sphingomonas lacunae TaxID=2698828 RepID=UPI0031B5F92B
MKTLVGRRFLTEQNGATAVEYALIATLIAVASILAWTQLGNDVSSNMDSVNAEMSNGIDPTQDGGSVGKN